MDLISVIVPIYNVEKYLDRCVESILNQTYTNLEIILVDDGSTDNCPAMCDSWAARDSRIKVIHKNNGGQSEARNYGIECANGEYISFIDSDDWIHPDFLKLMFEAAVQHTADIIACDVEFVYSDACEPSQITNHATLYSPEQALNTLISGNGFRAVVWNKLYHKTVVGNHRFILGKYRDDEFFTYKLLGDAKKLAFIHDKLYFYAQNSDSIMNTTSVKHLDALDAYVERLDYFNLNFPNIYIKDKCSFCFACVAFYSNHANIPKEQQRYYRKRIKSARKQIYFSLKELRLYSTKQILYILASRYFIGLFTKVLAFKRKQNDKAS